MLASCLGLYVRLGVYNNVIDELVQVAVYYRVIFKLATTICYIP